MGLFHYTDINAVRSIIEDQKFWLTHIRYMNDKSELVHYLNLFREKWVPKQLNLMLTRALGGQPATKEQLEFVFAQRKNIDDSLSEVTTNINAYVGSFCGKADLLSQWRGYTNGIIGYCIEFDESILNEYFSDAFKDNAKLKECVYKGEDHENVINQYVDKMLEEEVGDAEGDENRANIFRKLIDECSFFKPEAFAEENENRLRIFHDDEFDFRVRNGILIPYLEVDIPDKVIKSITVGPHENQTLAHQALTHYITAIEGAKSLSDDFEIKLSDISLRIF